MSTKILPYNRHRQKCEMYRCKNIAEYVITSEGCPPGVEIKICSECRNSILEGKKTKSRGTK